MHKRTLFIFRRDLRLEDNTGLIYALKNSDEVIPCFIFTPKQIDANPYRSDHCLQFMIESLEDLEEQLKGKGGRLYLFKDEPENVVEEAIKKLKIDAVVVNRDYTPFSIQRDKKIETVCKKSEIPFHSFDDALLHPPEKVLKSDGKPYSVFTPYYKAALKEKVAESASNRATNYYTKSIPFAESSTIYKKVLPKRGPCLHGGRKTALQILKKNFPHYAKERDFPFLKEATTHLSPHLKFTTISPREAYEAFHKNHDLIRSLIWRDFFTAIAFFYPHVFKGAFHEKYNKIEWSYDKGDFRRWCDGETGFPIVDAGMRELKQTGNMHNRVRMVVASFLVKDLHIDWRWGEKYFAQNLIDYDPAVNNGNWQWSASTGCDAQPYFRIFNPWNQQKKFDPDCEYIFKWIPELASLEPKEIHKWSGKGADYPAPMLDHAKEAKAALKAYKKVS
ncbi:MAG: deoxyribodipyrimidine photo-lyase [Verrucomicrobia bacterium]|nr:deoxyribodipyrimidine photo-lyase [Verrucomicrobiota bacterium]